MDIVSSLLNYKPSLFYIWGSPCSPYCPPIHFRFLSVHFRSYPWSTCGPPPSTGHFRSTVTGCVVMRMRIGVLPPKNKPRTHNILLIQYDNCDDFSFNIFNFPFICGKIPSAPAFEVFTSQFIRHTRAYRNYADFLYCAGFL